MTGENGDKREAFLRLAERRTNEVLNRIRILSNCSNRYAYEYTDEDVKKIFAAIDQELKAARSKFAHGNAERFSLRQGGPRMIERTEDIQFHREGTLRAVTRWVTGHDEGVSELFKNVRRAYQADRLDVEDENRGAVLLLKDGDPAKRIPAQLGVLDVGGATLDDVEAWSVWDDPQASNRGSELQEEENAGKRREGIFVRLVHGSVPDPRRLGRPPKL